MVPASVWTAESIQDGRCRWSTILCSQSLRYGERHDRQQSHGYSGRSMSAISEVSGTTSRSSGTSCGILTLPPVKFTRRLYPSSWRAINQRKSAPITSSPGLWRRSPNPAKQKRRPRQRPPFLIPNGCERDVPACCADLLNLARRRVTLLRDDRVLHRLALLVDDAKRLTRTRIDQLDFDLAELPVASLIRRIVGHRVLVPKRVGDRPENAWKLAIEAREEGHPAGLLGKRPHLVIRLKEVETCDRAHVAIGVEQFAVGLHQPDSVNRDSRVLERLAGFVERQLAKGIHTG